MSEWTLNLGDCLCGLRSMGNKSVDHIITDPPYEDEAHTKQRRKSKAVVGVEIVQPLNFQPIGVEERVLIAFEIARVVRRWAIVFCQAEAVQAWRDAVVAGGLHYRRACVWIKPDPMPQLTGDRPGMGYESIVVAHTPGRSRWNGGGRAGVYEYTARAPDNIHPTQKPLPLMEALVRDFTDAGETILDPFAGSGTTGVAALRMGRKFIGWERDERYHAIATKRLEAVREQPELFGSKKVKVEQLGLLGGSK